MTNADAHNYLENYEKLTNTCLMLRSQIYADAHNYLESRERAESLSPVSERGGEEDLLVKGEGRGDRGDMGDRGELQGGPPPPPPPSRFRTCSWLRATSRRSTSPSFSVSCSTT